jgi:hypothetical protein
MKPNLWVASLAIAGILLPACSQPGGPLQPTHATTTVPATITSRSQLNQYLEQTAGKGSPLDALSPGGRERFLESLRFGEKGLGSFRYTDLLAELTAAQTKRILSLFGAQQVTPLVYGHEQANYLYGYPVKSLKNYQCIAKGTCQRETGAICLSSC